MRVAGPEVSSRPSNPATQWYPPVCLLLIKETRITGWGKKVQKSATGSQTQPLTGTVKSSNVVTVSKCRHPSGKYLYLPARLSFTDIKIFYLTHLLLNTSLWWFCFVKKNIYKIFFEDLGIGVFSDDIYFKNFKKSYWNHPEGGTMQHGY